MAAPIKISNLDYLFIFRAIFISVCITKHSTSRSLISDTFFTNTALLFVDIEARNSFLFLKLHVPTQSRRTALARTKDDRPLLLV